MKWLRTDGFLDGSCQLNALCRSRNRSRAVLTVRRKRDYLTDAAGLICTMQGSQCANRVPSLIEMGSRSPAVSPFNPIYAYWQRCQSRARRTNGLCDINPA